MIAIRNKVMTSIQRSLKKRRRRGSRRRGEIIWILVVGSVIGTCFLLLAHLLALNTNNAPSNYNLLNDRTMTEVDGMTDESDTNNNDNYQVDSINDKIKSNNRFLQSIPIIIRHIAQHLYLPHQHRSSIFARDKTNYNNNVPRRGRIKETNTSSPKVISENGTISTSVEEIADELDLDYDPFQTQLNASINDRKLYRNDLFTFYCKQDKVRRVLKRNRNLIVFENFIRGNALGEVKCHESITYTTHGDYRYLDNLLPLLDRWGGPVSLAIYAPGDDLRKTMSIISYLRDCTDDAHATLIRSLVAFHIFFEAMYVELPESSTGQAHFQWLDSIYESERWKDCRLIPNVKALQRETTFRGRKKLLYPVNIARNIARNAAPTYFVLASDIELYPSVSLISAFFGLLERMVVQQPYQEVSNHGHVILPAKQVFVLPIFEVRMGVAVPRTKRELLPLLNVGKALPFHNSICRECHLVPRYEEWKKSLPVVKGGSGEEVLRVFYKAKRKAPFHMWEPIFIGTKYEPTYDERLSWEGLRDKMTQGYILCALNYDFLILDNAFLVHRPGVKRVSHRVTKTVMKQDRLINSKIKSELNKKFGIHNGCFL